MQLALYRTNTMIIPDASYVVSSFSTEANRAFRTKKLAKAI
jgi:hypothetical protein